MFGLLVRAGYKVEGGAPASHTHNHVHHAGMSNWDVVHAWGWKGVMCAAMRWCSTMAGPNHSHTAHPFFQPVELCRSLSSSVDCPVIDLLHGISDFLHLPRPPAWHGRRASVLSPKRTAVRYGDNDTSSWSDWYTEQPSHFTIAKDRGQLYAQPLLPFNLQQTHNKHFWLLSFPCSFHSGPLGYLYTDIVLKAITSPFPSNKQDGGGVTRAVNRVIFLEVEGSQVCITSTYHACFLTTTVPLWELLIVLLCRWSMSRNHLIA